MAYSAEVASAMKAGLEYWVYMVHRIENPHDS
jgi:hypothetical protein